MVKLYNPVLPITTEKIQDDAVNYDKIADQSIASGLVYNKGLDTRCIADDCIETLQILDGNVTAAKIVTGAVVGKTMECEMWLSPVDMVRQDVQLYDGKVYNQYAQPYVTGTAFQLRGQIHLPVGAIITEVIFYGELDHAGSSLNVRLERNYNIDGAINQQLLHDVNITGVTGVQSSIYAGDYALVTNETLTIYASMVSVTAADSSKYRGCKVTYTF